MGVVTNSIVLIVPYIKFYVVLIFIDPVNILTGDCICTMYMYANLKFIVKFKIKHYTEKFYIFL